MTKSMQSRTNIVLDDKLVAQAMRKAGVDTKKAAVEAALKAYVKKPDYSGLIALVGSGIIDPNYDPKALFLDQPAPLGVRTNAQSHTTPVVTRGTIWLMQIAAHSILTSSIASLPLLARGKVRDNYAVGVNRILMVASDRLSAFDVIMGEGVPDKGVLLTQMALFWFEKLGHICPNHLTGDDPLSVVTEAEKPHVRGRSMLVKRLKPVMIEAVVRGYLAGSGWAEYQSSQSVCGVTLPAGLKNASKLPEPIFTPAAKAAVGEHDENISFQAAAGMIGEDLATKIRAISLSLYQTAADFALTKGIIIADTKFEFGLDADGTLVLMDEVLTPDSSRFWPAETYTTAFQAGKNPPSYDKQFVRDWLESAEVNGQPWNKQAPAPQLPADVLEKTAAKYHEALQRLTA